ncbi:RNA helicase [Malassezia vespertilionis]|uniref:ATP-dependent RNA helicase n=1 Tax=Malassezia vespertilionis TaxID=2020962 RepID=A0A2N1JBU0_9BASI|nr:RNA helicase [Malassezia vespertilionis]PKI84008.1 Dbp7p [Malassezia vespertilionis]WFD06810.1 RNA helicase [Malassezia vespertilionis]
MEEDDLLLNFDTSAPLPAKKRRQNSHGQAHKRAHLGDDSTEHPAHKRARENPSDRRTIDIARKITQAHTHSAPKTTGYVSSLFARNDTLAAEPEDVPQASPIAPSNAPVLDGTFEGLGLDPLIARHLRARMGIDGRPTEIQQRAIPPLLAVPPQMGCERDILVQAQTGSGKTLTYLLPIIQSLLPLSQESFIDRSVGTLSIILAPSRELARQIYTVLERLLTLSLASTDQDDQAPKRYSRWIVPGLLTGGSTKNHEKQRLRKGCSILVATPGRLLDHLQNTSSLDVGKCRWLVLDEADRLLEMGFQEQLEGIIKALDGRRRLALGAARDAMLKSEALAPGDKDDAHVVDSLGVSWWAVPRRLILCSATLDERVQAFSGTTLRNPLLVRAGADTETHAEQDGPTFSAPSQLQQHAVVTAPKLRLVALVALLRHTIPRMADVDKIGPARVIVFISATDSVNFHWEALGGAKMRSVEQPKEPDATEKEPASLAQYSELLPNTPIFRLHGSMPQKERIASLRAFQTLSTEQPCRGGVLLCTPVASRGLDLPDVRCVIQMDVPTEGGAEEYVHRIGRTARAGRQGTSWLMLLPHEEPWLQTLERRVVVREATGMHPPKITVVGIDTVLFEGFGGAFREYESRATDVQMAVERWVLRDEKHTSLARTAFLAYIRAYATHPAAEKALFNVNQLHLGHLAKAFALREAPNTVQKLAKREHDKKAKEKPKRDAMREQHARMMAHLPAESM